MASFHGIDAPNRYVTLTGKIGGMVMLSDLSLNLSERIIFNASFGYQKFGQFDFWVLTKLLLMLVALSLKNQKTESVRVCREKSGFF